MKSNNLFVFFSILTICTNITSMEKLTKNPDIVGHICAQTVNIHTSMNLLSTCKSLRAILFQGQTTNDIQKCISHFIINTPNLFSSLSNKLYKDIRIFVMDNYEEDHPNVEKIKNFHKNTLLLKTAVEKSDTKEVRSLLDLGANCNYRHKISRAEYILELYGTLANPFLHYACHNGSVEIATLLLEHGALINAVDDYERTALFVATNVSKPAEIPITNPKIIAQRNETNEQALLELLVKYGININKLDSNKNPALYYAYCKNNLKIVRFLIEHGALAPKECLSLAHFPILGGAFNWCIPIPEDRRTIQKLCLNNLNPEAKKEVRFASAINYAFFYLIFFVLYQWYFS